MLVAMAATAQTPTATLSHEGTVKCFYGKEALVNAVAEAENGDNITLSSGLFSGTTIDKAITVKGAGMSPDTINNITPTTISSALTINTSDVTVEGTYIAANLTLNHFNNIKIISCAIAGLITNENNSNKGMVNKYFIGSKALNHDTSISNPGFNVRCDSINFYITNSYIRHLEIGNYKNAIHVEATNSLIGFPAFNYINYSSFTNCILWCYLNSGRYLNSSNYAYYCVGVDAPDMFKYILSYGTDVGITNKTVANFSDIFKTFTGDPSEFETFELTSSAQTTFLGDDGTQVGIYGGSMPFNPKPNNPYITKLTVAEKSTPQGTLSVDIQVQPAQ